MNLKKLLLTNNECYIANKNKKHIPKGGLLHSTGANNPYLSRYIAPDDGLLGKPSSQHWNQVLTGGRKACVHAFIGKLKDGSVATYQVLPWDMPCWGSGSGSLGPTKNANNNGYLQVEICEDGLNDKDYFDLVYKEAVELFAYWSKKFNWNPLTDIICHSEGHKKGISSNHADVMHWFPKYGKNMDLFRQDVKKKIEQGGEDMTEKVYNTLSECPDYAKPTIKKLIDKKLLNGSSNGLNLTESMLRILVITDRAGLYK